MIYLTQYHRSKLINMKKVNTFRVNFAYQFEEQAALKMLYYMNYIKNFIN